MTRKRFIKLLMSHGESKRGAYGKAHLYNILGMPYKNAYANYIVKKSLREAIESYRQAWINFGLTLRGLITKAEQLKDNITEDTGNENTGRNNGGY